MTFDPDRLPSESSEHPTAFDFDCLIGGDLPPDEARQLERHAADCDACGALLARLSMEPPNLHEARTLAAIRQELTPPTSGWRAWLSNARMAWALGGLAAAAAAVIVFTQRPEVPSEDPAIRAKGALQLHVLRRVDGGAARVASGETITPRETLRFQITLPESARVRIVGIEPDGTLYTAWPLDGQAADTIWPAGEKQPLPGAVHLDGPSGTEQLHLVACPAAVDDACVSTGPGTPPRCADACSTSPFSFVRP